MKYMRTPMLTYFLTDTLNWQVLWGKEKYLLNSLYEKLKIRFLQNKCKEPASSKDKQINLLSNF